MCPVRSEIPQPESPDHFDYICNKMENSLEQPDLFFTCEENHMLKPDHSKRPLSLIVERLVPASVEMLYKAWTVRRQTNPVH